MSNEPSMQRRRQLHGTIELHQMPCAVDQFKLSTWNQLCQSMSPVNRDPTVVVAPDYENGQIEVWVEAFDLIGMCLIRLRNLPVERSPTLSIEPRGDQGVHLGRAEADVACSTHIGPERPS